MVSFLRSFYFLVMLFVTTLIGVLAVFVCRFGFFLVGKEIPSDLVHYIGIVWGRGVFRLAPGWTEEILGKENIPPSSEKKPFIIIANHESASDIFVIYLLAVQFRWLAKAEMFRIPLLNIAMRWAGYVPVKRSDKDSRKRALERSAEILAKNTPMLFFPEGTRSSLGTPQTFKSGAFVLAKQQQVPILPVVLVGTGNLLNKGSVVPNKAKVIIKVLPLTSARDDEDGEAFKDRIEKMIKDEHAKLTV
jgi:1-acyl-sn-glycerol-3-phosphate acyltransferase